MTAFTIDDRRPWPLGSFTNLAAVSDVRHGVTTRDGPAFGTDATSAETAAAAASAAEAVGLPGTAWVRQVHGATVLRVRTPGLAGEADGLVTDVPGLAVLGRSADCPLILAAGTRDDGSAAVGFAHASWRATVRGIAANLVAGLADLGAAAATITAAIAPSAGPCCYEVGDEVREEAVTRCGEAIAGAFAPAGDRWHFDLWAANRQQLATAGVADDRVATAGICTICHGERFWSWRVQRERAGRFAAFIGVAPA